jgi:UDP-3-O-[3-hydroxymyristoyl] glucosamine N-acyltransferase
VVDEGAVIGPRTVVGPGCVVARGARVGADCLLHPRVVVEHGCVVGDRCILQAGAVVGGDGFGFASVAGVHHKVPQVGRAVLEDDVELGANTTVDRGSLGDTVVGRGSKVDNLVMIAHNVRLGQGCILAAQVGLAGSTHLGRYVVMGGQSGMAGHLEIGDGAQIAAKAAVFKDLAGGQLYSGIPARPFREWTRSQAAVARLQQLKDRVRELERRFEAAPGDVGDDAT